MPLESNPLVTVYIPSKNYGNYLEQAIESVLRQTYQEIQLLLIDDNSEDNSWQIIGNYVNNENIIGVKTEGIGLPGIANLALELSKGKYIIRVDGDDLLHEYAISIMVESMIKKADDSFVFSDYYTIDPENRIMSHEIRSKVNIEDHYQTIPPHGACTMWKTDVLRKAGGYRIDLGAQDGFDIWTRLKSEITFHNINLPLFSYRQHSSNLTKNSEKILKARRQIKRDFINEKLKTTSTVIAVIPCRKNYDYVPNLWSVDFDGKSLLYLAVESCVNSELVSKIIITCDGENILSEIAEMQMRFPTKEIHFFKRTTNSTINTIPITETLKEISKEFDPDLEGIIILKYLQAPFVKSETIDEMISTIIYENSDSCTLVERINSTVLKRSKFGLEVLSEPNIFNSTFDSIYRYSNLLLCLKSSNLKVGSLWGSKIAYLESAGLNDIYIDSAEKYKIAIFLQRNHNL